MPAVGGMGPGGSAAEPRAAPPPRYMLWFEGEGAKTLVLLDASHGVPLRYVCGAPPATAAAAAAAATAGRLPLPSAPQPPPWPLAADPAGLLRTRCLADEAASPGAALPLAGGASLAARRGGGGGAARLVCLSSGGALDAFEEGEAEEGVASQEPEREGGEAEEEVAYEARARKGGEGAGASVAADGSAAVGSSVVIVGLKAKPQLNGQAASVLGWDETKGRYKVSLSGGGVVASGGVLALKPANLETPRMQRVVVTVPAGMAPGMEVQFLTPQLPPQRFNAVIPPGCQEGARFEVEVPMPPPPPPSAPELRMRKLRVTVPPEARGGEVVKVMTHLGLQSVQVPDGLQEGDVFDMICHPNPDAEGVGAEGGVAGPRAGEVGAGEWGLRRVEAPRTTKLASMVEEATAVMEAAYGRSVPPPPSPPPRAGGVREGGVREGGAEKGDDDRRVQMDCVRKEDCVRMPPPPPPSSAPSVLPSATAAAANAVTELPSRSAAPSRAQGADQAGEGADPAADQEATEPRLLATLRAQWGGWESSRRAGAAPPTSAPGATPGQAGGAGATSCASFAALSRGARPAESRRGARLSWSDAFATGSAPPRAGGAAPASPSPASGTRSDRGFPSIRPATSAIAQFVPLEAASRSKKPAKRRKSSGFA